MTGTEKSGDLDRLIAECRRRRRAGADEEALIAWLRMGGLPLFPAIRVLMGAFGWSAGEAARRVYLNPAWAETRVLLDSLGDVLETALADPPAEDADPPKK